MKIKSGTHLSIFDTFKIKGELTGEANRQRSILTILANSTNPADRTRTGISQRIAKEKGMSWKNIYSGIFRDLDEILIPLEIVEEDRSFYEMSGGGVTLGGGEVLMQPEAAANLLMACKKEGINTAIETSGYASLSAVLQVAEFTDLFLYDMKHMDSDEHFENTGVRNERILNNLSELLKRRYNVKIRMPLLKGINDSWEEIDQVIQFLLPFKDYKNFKGIDLLPYHKFGVNKYNQLGKDYQINDNPSMTLEDMERIESWFKQYDFQVKVVNH